ncbi:phosphatase PAP2 family protein [Brachybacterium vulturis]|uniref:phosphatase PAP2 family protein n=1 Tax=Brachybacterium vulturis TaxID=2017484 RepID=UPI0012FE0F95|nr:phosphatase PAP2 family protein [Brachybacterium vulturis]
MAAAGSLAVLVLLLVRGMTYRGTVAWSTHLPGPVQSFFSAVSEYGILGLLALFAVAALRARRRGLTHLARGIAAGFGVIAAYVSSEILKVLFSELRPCHHFTVATIAACPEAADWSWPSNHATISAAIALAVLSMAPRLGLLALPLAGLIGFSRVAVGVHYFHDVLAGVLLAALAVTVLTAVGTPPVARSLTWCRRFPLLDRLLTASPDRHRARPPRHVRLDSARTAQGRSERSLP